MRNRFLSILLCILALIVSSASSVAFAKEGGRQLPIYRVGRDDKLISISFDCAWGDEYTEELLDVMDKYGVKCTFFAVKFWTEKYPEHIKEISARGHEIGTHSSTHSHMSKMSEADIIEELNVSAKAISELTGKKVELFRAPFGEYDDTLIKTATGLGLYTVQWDVDSLDWKDLSAKEIAARVTKKVKSGSIILCHNNGLHTAESLPIIFEDLQKKGYKFAPIGELIYRENFTILPNGEQVKRPESETLSGR